jgi:hypothetical protein
MLEAATDEKPESSKGSEKTAETDPSAASTSDSYKYDENGMMVYTDPATQTEYVLDPSGSNWIPKSESASKYKFDGETYLYTDDKTGVKHRWDLKEQSWVKIDDSQIEKRCVSCVIQLGLLKVCLYETSLFNKFRTARQTKFCKIDKRLKFGGKVLITE